LVSFRKNAAAIRLVAILIVIFAQPAMSQVRESACQGAKINFPKAMSEVQERLQRYAESVGKSDGSDNCSSECLHLRTAQSSLDHRYAASHVLSTLTCKTMASPAIPARAAEPIGLE
jgi:hypothetical protein